MGTHTDLAVIEVTINATLLPSADVACTLFYDHKGIMTSHRVLLYSSIVFVIIGLLGNLICMMVFSTRAMRPISSNFYLLMLAISDAMYLLGIFLTKILDTLYCLYFKGSSISIYNQNRALCKILQFLLDLFSDYSMCLVLAFTVERLIAVYAPIRFKHLCTLKRAQLVCLFIFVTIALSTAPYHFLFMDLEVSEDGRSTVCSITLVMEKMFSTLYVVETVLYRVTPLCLIACCNISIICKVTLLAKKRRRWLPSNNRQRNTEDKNMQLTVMLIIVSSAHIILCLPVLTNFLLVKLRREGHYIPVDPLYVFRNYAQGLYVVGYAINFFLYTMSGRLFREQLVHLLCDRFKRRSGQENGVELHQINTQTVGTSI